MGSDDRHAEAQRQAQARRIGKLVFGPGEGMLGPGVDEQGQTQLSHSAVERGEAFVSRVDELDRGQPFDQDRVVSRRLVQASQGIGAVGIDAGAEEQVGVARG